MRKARERVFWFTYSSNCLLIVRRRAWKQKAHAEIGYFTLVVSGHSCLADDGRRKSHAREDDDVNERPPPTRSFRFCRAKKHTHMREYDYYRTRQTWIEKNVMFSAESSPKPFQCWCRAYAREGDAVRDSGQSDWCWQNMRLLYIRRRNRILEITIFCVSFHSAFGSSMGGSCPQRKMPQDQWSRQSSSLSRDWTWAL